jgi:hypothetical protein
LLAAGTLAALLLAVGTTVIGEVSEEAKQRRERGDFGLFSAPSITLEGNQVSCGLLGAGKVCKELNDSPSIPGGFWPKGSPNAYIFNTGLQVAGIIGSEGGGWANDTTAAFFFDPKGSTEHGDLIAPDLPSITGGAVQAGIVTSLNSEDIKDENWPIEAVIADTELYDPVLIGLKAASQEDSWTQYWDGNPARINGRQHPLGIKVTQRSHAWNFPRGNESLIYFTYEFENVSHRADFRDPNVLAFFGGDATQLPVDGYAINELYAAFGTDMDVTDDAGANFSTAILPFDIGISYHGGFNAPEFAYPPEIFQAPFFTRAPGIVGIKYLKSPINPQTGEEVGLTLFSWTINPSGTNPGFPDAPDDRALWRYLSGNLDPAAGDFPCNVTPEVDVPNPDLIERSVCFMNQSADDTRFYMASGPFTLAPQEKAKIVVAYIMAPTVETMPDGSLSGVTANSSNDDANPPGIPSFHPGFASARGCLPDGTDCSVFNPASTNIVKSIEKGAGWVSYEGPAPTGRATGALEGPENKLDEAFVETVPGSLLDRALVAQAVFDNKFLLGFAPEQPVAVYLVPGDNQVSILWEASPSEETGDPFFSVAQDEQSLLYNPNYRGDPDGDAPGDVEGYRIYRRTLAGEAPLLVHQEDYADTRFFDFTCETVLPTESGFSDEGDGFAPGEECLIDSDDPLERFITSDGLVFNNGGPGGAPGAGTARLSNGDVIYITELGVVDDEGTTQPLTDTGVGFAWTDTDVQNNFAYEYAVEAFDVNSPKSASNTLRSARVFQTVIPRADVVSVFAELSVEMFGGDGEPLDPTQGVVIDAETGIFDPMPPSNGVEASFFPEIAALLPAFERGVRIDSMVPDFQERTACVATDGFQGWSFRSGCYKLYVTGITDGDETPFVISETSVSWARGFGNGDGVQRIIILNTEVPLDHDALVRNGVDTTTTGLAQAIGNFDEHLNYSSFEGQQNRRAVRTRTIHQGSRWFSGTVNTTPDPAMYIRVGHLAEVDSVWAPIHHTQMDSEGVTGTSCENCIANSGTVQYFGYLLAFLGRAADVQFTWGDGTFASVRDVTHNVDLPFHPDYRAGTWGFLNGDCSENDVVDWEDYFCVGESAIYFQASDNAGLPANQPGSVLSLEATPQLVQVALNTTSPATATGTGFALYINGERYFFLADELPPDGTVWTLRTHTGSVRTSTASYLTDDPSGYSYVPVYDNGGEASGLRPPVPGTSYVAASVSPTTLDAPLDLTLVHVVPDPYLGSSQLDLGPTEKRLQFVNLPAEATIRIYTLTGVLVDVIDHNDVTGGGRADWDLRNRNDNFVASGVYFFHVITPGKEEYVGKFTVVNFGAQN